MLQMASFLHSNKVLRPDGTQVRHIGGGGRARGSGGGGADGGGWLGGG
jgi:hypothetical protein